MENEEVIDIACGKNVWETSRWRYREESIFEIAPEVFLSYAKSDFKLKETRNQINALSNVKRAIDCQVDSILFVLGYRKLAKSQRWGFPAKAEFLNSIGILSPSILKRVNSKRNLLEHNFKLPKRNEIEDAIDVAELFIEATRKFSDRIYRDFSLEVSTRVIKSKEGDTEITNLMEIFYDIRKREFKFEFSEDNQEYSVVVNRRHERFNDLIKNYVLGIKLG